MAESVVTVCVCACTHTHACAHALKRRSEFNTKFPNFFCDKVFGISLGHKAGRLGYAGCFLRPRDL